MKYVIDETTLKNLADTIRKINGETRTYTPTEMIDEVVRIMDSATYILVEAGGAEIPAFYVDTETKLTATTNDIRVGMTAVNGDGIVTGEKVIPSYNTLEGVAVVTNGSVVKIPTVTDCEYTKLQALVCSYNTSIADSVSTKHVCIENYTYPVNSTIAASKVSVNTNDKSISFGITNNSGKLQIIRYFMYKEIY